MSRKGSAERLDANVGFAYSKACQHIDISTECIYLKIALFFLLGRKKRLMQTPIDSRRWVFAFYEFN
jgi:hypothetical protein